MERIKEAVVVTPAQQTPNRILQLSAIDSQLFLRFTIEYLLIYEPQPGTDPNTIPARIKSGLSKALVPYYPLAGRVRRSPNGAPGLEVTCREQGALFIEATSELTVSEFKRAPCHVSSWRSLLSLYVEDVLKGAPPLVVQITSLRDGGFALGVGINHCLCDGIGSSEFLNLLADLSHLGKKSLTDVKSLKPVWDRHLMNPAPNPLLFNRNDNISLPEFDPNPDLCNFMIRFSHERLTPTSFIFDDRSLSKLKTTVSQSSSFTSFEVLSAHVWQSWARALCLPGSQMLKLLFSVNVRERVRPSLPPGYYGNAFVLGCAVSTARDLTEKGLAYAAGLVRAAKERVGDEHVRRVVEAVAEREACPDPVGVLIVSQWSRLGLENVDFGLGGPAHVGPVCIDRYCLFLPVPDQRDAVRVMVAVPTNAVDNYYSHLLMDPRDMR